LVLSEKKLQIFAKKFAIFSQKEEREVEKREVE